MTGPSYFATYQRLGVSIWESERAVIRATWQLMLSPQAKSDLLKYRNQRHMLYRRLLGHHRAARKLAREFRL